MQRKTYWQLSRSTAPVQYIIYSLVSFRCKSELRKLVVSHQVCKQTDMLLCIQPVSAGCRGKPLNTSESGRKRLESRHWCCISCPLSTQCSQSPLVVAHSRNQTVAVDSNRESFWWKEKSIAIVIYQTPPVALLSSPLSFNVLTMTHSY